MTLHALPTVRLALAGAAREARIATALTPVLPTVQGHVFVGPDGRHRVQGSHTRSLDCVWLYENADSGGTPWEITHTPTGEHLQAGNLRRARAITADPDTLRAMRAQALHVIVRGGADSGATIRSTGWHGFKTVQTDAERAANLHRARRTVAILDGHLVAASRTPEALCHGCGGLLIYRDEWIHVDGCVECWTGDGWQPCTDIRPHVWCGQAEPVTCRHSGCLDAARALSPHPCQNGHDACCGCCQTEPARTGFGSFRLHGEV